MPYKSFEELPSYIKKFPKAVAKAWMKVFNTAYAQYGEEKAFMIANAWVKKRIKKSGNDYVADSADFETIEIYSISLTPASEEFITNSESGEFIFNAILSDSIPWIHPSGEMVNYTVDCLNDFAKQINDTGLTLPDIEHEEFDKIVNESLDVEEVTSKIRERKGLLKNVKAEVVNGQLLISAKLDSRYKNYINFYKNLSIEAVAKREGSKYVGGKILGFTFTKNPRVKTARVL